ncbi:MAG: Zn-ribbon domain-containing OB-fold protein [Syntrophomonadales bacterium]|jgi:uncharacterized OB-fold protein
MKRPFMPATPASEPYWSYLKRNELWIPRCDSCSQLVFYPREICPHCSGLEFTWEKMSGRGEVYSFTVIRRPFLPEFASLAPYVFAIIELEEGIRMASNVINCQPEDVYIGLSVQAVYDEDENGRKLVLFKPA